MAYRDWLKEYRESQGSNSTPKTTQATASQKPTSGSSGSVGSGSSFSDYLREYREKNSTDSLQGWATYSKMLLDDIQKSSGKWQDRTAYQTHYNNVSKMLALADGWRKQYSGNTEAISYIDSVVHSLTQGKYKAADINKYYSQWDTEDDYNSWYAIQQDKAQKLEADTAYLQTELDEMVDAQKQYKSAVNTLKEHYLTNDYSFVSKEDVDKAIAYAKMVEEKYGITVDKTIDQIVNEKKLYLSDAKRLQESAKLASVSGNADFTDHNGYVSTKADSIWADMTSQYGLGYDDLTYEYINNQNGIRDKIKQKYRSYSSDGGGDGESIFEEKGYDHMDEEEIRIYNYHYAKDGKEAAQKYLDSIQETLNERKAGKMYANMEDKTLLEFAFGVAAGLDQFESGAKGVWNAIAGNDEYIPASATQMASSMVREDLADKTLPVWYNFKKGQWEDQVFGRSVGQAVYDAITTTSNMAPSIMTSWALSMVNPVAGSAWVTAGQIAGTGMMGASAAGNAYQEVINLGYDKEQAQAYAAMVGASEAGLQYLLGGISKMGGKLSGNVVTKIMNGVDNAFARTAIKLGGNMISEGLEEGLQEVLTPYFQNLVLHTENDVDWNEVAYSSLLGALTAGFLEGSSTIAGEVNTYKTGKNLQAADISAQRLAELGKTFSADTVAYQLAGRVDENTGAYTMGRLFNEIGATLSEQNVTEITNALVAKGMDEITASKNAKGLAYVVEGGQLSERQIAVIEANDVLAEVARTTLIDANTTWNQRSKGYNDMLKALADEVTSSRASQAEQVQQGVENAPTDGSADGQKKSDTESHYEAETVDTSPAKVKDISSIDKGNVTIKLEDDSEVSLKDADLAPDDGVRIETIASIEGISATDASFVFNTLRENTGASAQMDALGAKEAYKYGFYGFSMDHMTKHGVFANSLTEAQRQAIYEIGKKARQMQIESSSPIKGTGIGRQTEIYFDYGNGNVVAFRDAKKILTEKQTAGVQAAMILRKLGIGGDIYFFESYRNDKGQLVYKDKNGNEKKAPNGWYSPGDGSIHIDLNAGTGGKGFVLFTLAHELTHFIEQWSPQKYKALADFLVENYEKGQSMDSLVRAKQAKLSAQRGKKVSYKEAYSEVVADSMEAMLADGNVLEKLVELKAKDNDLFTKMKQFFDNLLNKIRGIHNGQTPDSVEGSAVLEMTDSIEKIQQLFAEALADAGENFRTAEKNTTEEGGVQMMVRENVVDVKGNIYEKVIKPGLKVYDSVKHKKKDYISHIRKKIFKRTFNVNDSNGEQITVEFGKDGEIVQKDGSNNPHPVLGELEATTDRLKMIAIINIKDLIKNSKPLTPSSENSHQWLDAEGWRDRISYMMDFDFVYPVILHIPKTRDGRYLLYDVSVLKKEGTSIDMDATALAAPGARAPETTENGLQSAVEVLEPSDGRVAQPEPVVNSESAEALDIEVDEDTESVAPAVQMSERTWTESDYVQEREKAAKEISKAIGVSVKKAKAYIDSVNSIAKMIAEDRVRLDYFSSPGRSSFVGNVEYGGSFDFSTLCKKRRLLTGTFTAIQKALPNTALTADEILKIRNRMKEAGLEVSCGLCYVEGSRANVGQFAKEFLKLYKQYYPDAWQPNMADVNTPDGIEWVRINHPECYEQYEYFWNHYGTLKPGDKNLFASQQKPKLYQLHTEYKGEILEKFNDDDNVEEKNLNGGIRLQSFSDFEIVHLIDTMQIIMDMSRVGLAGQAYTKVPDFAWALGDTGLKINLSLIAKGVDENGKLIFDDVEGMPIDQAVELRNRYSKNVGTILVAFNDEQLLAAMADDRVDFIIPFHRSQWKKSQYEAMGLPAKTKDYTYMQNEKFIKPQYHEYRGRMVKDKATNYMPNEYWNFGKSGKENAEAYLEMCARNNKRPKFYKLLQNNGDGSYSLKADGSTDGYWKLLIDFKMYDNDGNGSPQMPVKPEFNMDEAQRMLNDYQGGHSSFPVAQGIVDDFVSEYKDSHKGALYSDRDSEGGQLYSDRVLMGSLFSGGGTLEAGLVYQMLDKEFAVENNEKIAATYTDNHGKEHMFVGDVRDFNSKGKRNVFYLHASPVCKNFSPASHGGGEKTLDIVTARATARVLEEQMPQVFTVENVKRYIGSEAYNIITDKLTKLGYKWDVDVYKASDYGNATKRERMIIRAVKDGDLPAKPKKASGITSWGDATRDLWDTDLIPSTLVRSKIEAIRNTPQLKNLRLTKLDRPLMIYDTTKSKQVTYAWADELAPTLTTKCGDARIIMPDGRVYEPTPKFMGRIQGLPDNYKYPKAKTNAFKIIGNGIPTQLTKAVIGGVLDSAYEQTHDGKVLYQDRAEDSVSNRSLLANAFEGLAQNDIEKNKIQEYKEKISLINSEEQKLRELNEQIKELSFSKGPRDTKKIRGLQFEANQAANRINTYDRQLLRLEASKPLQDVLAREKKKAYQKAEKRGKEALAAYKEKTAKTQRELLERWQDSRKKGIEGRHKTAMRHKIKDVVNELNQYLLRGTKDRHVPESLQKAVAEALNAVNMDTVGADERIAKLKAELLKAKTPEQIQDISRKIDHIQEMGDRMNGRLKKLKDAYDDLLKSPDENTRNAYDDVIHNKLDSVIDKIGNTPLRDMTLAQLEDVYDMYRMVLTAIRDVNKSFKDAKNQSISTRANAVMAQVEEVGGKHKLSPTILNGIKKFGWNNLKPVYAFEHIGSVTLTEAFKNVRAGEDVWAMDIVEARKFYLDKTKQYKYDSWDFQKQYEFKSTSGMEFSLNLEQILSLYAYSKRDQAEDHLKYGGIVFDESTKIIKKTKLGISLEFNPADATAYNISEETLAEIISNLTDDQKAFADEMQHYLSYDMGAKGNEVSMAMYDIKLFKDKNYFPLKSAQQFMEKARDQQKGEVKIKNSGFSKETVPHAKNPIVLTPFMDVWANHINEMSMYHAFVLPLEDFYRIYNYKTPSKDVNLATEGVNQYIQNAYGRAATAYIDQLLKDLNGGARSDSTTGIINKMMGLFKKGSVFASLSVVVQQPSAIARAAALVDTKYFIGPKVDHKRHKALWDEVKQYAPVAIIKEMGYFDTNMGKSTQDFIQGKEYKGFSEKMKALVKDSNYRDEVLSKAPALADEIGWCSIWEAVKRETQAKNPGMDVKSDAFLKMAGERFTEVITKTQVYDSVLSRSGHMRSKDTGMKMATAFMAEPTTSINMMADALLQGLRGDWRKASRQIGSVVASCILNAILVSFVYAGRDDDEEETYLEKYIGTLSGEVLDSLNPLTYIPFIKDIVSIVQGYDVERSDMAVVSDLWNSFENLSKDNVSAYRKVEGFVGSVAQLFGLPVKNIMRDARGIYQTVMSFVNGQQTTAAGIGYAVKGAITGKDVANYQQLYEAYLSGDKEQKARVSGRFKDQNAINNAIRKALRENDPRIHEAAVAWNANDLDEYMRIAKAIIAEKHFVQDDVVMAIRSEANSLAPDDGATSTSKAKGMFTAEKFAEAIAQGDQAMANAIKTDIIRTEQKNGKTEEKAEETFVSSAKTAMKEMFLAGDLSEQKAIDAIVTYCGKSEDDALADVQYWAFKQDYPDVYADDAWFDTYYDKIADSGIDIDVYMEYRNTVSTITGDGKKERRMAVIDSLPITSAQKDALYFAEGWTESKLYEAPWH